MEAGLSRWVLFAIELMAGLFLLALIVLLVGGAVLYVLDRSQTGNAIRRNFPVIGRFRALFEHLGEFFRQYFFAFDRQE
ncbi:MAG TPA: FMN-binding glutamate synthase family protein, partial [Mizugakiibacter sp.]